jgi:hypothetical protein
MAKLSGKKSINVTPRKMNRRIAFVIFLFIMGATSERVQQMPQGKKANTMSF